MVFFELSRRLPLLRRAGAVLGAIRRIDFTEYDYELNRPLKLHEIPMALEGVAIDTESASGKVA